jgi:hypothetical protein
MRESAQQYLQAVKISFKNVRYVRVSMSVWMEGIIIRGGNRLNRGMSVMSCATRSSISTITFNSSRSKEKSSKENSYRTISDVWHKGTEWGLVTVCFSTSVCPTVTTESKESATGLYLPRDPFSPPVHYTLRLRLYGVAKIYSSSCNAYASIRAGGSGIAGNYIMMQFASDSWVRSDV